MNVWFKKFAIAAACLGCAASTIAGDKASGVGEPKLLNIYNWSDYIADDTIRHFEKETGIKVN